MTNVLIVYASQFGNTEKMAKAMEQTLLESSEIKCQLKKAETVTETDFINADAIILGSPVKMGSIDWQLKKMIDTVMGSLWVANKLVGKVGGTFASGGGFGKGGAGAEITFTSLANVLMEMGIIYVPLPKNTQGYKFGGIQWGAYGVSANEDMQPQTLMENQLEVCRIHAQNIARVAKTINGQNLFQCELEN
ncbi:hypothetical protein KO529_16535 [Arenibacter algicola]|uniref:flavodoxin family protein n=1 Tax=Arenibacter algicola TaxID=616991 RepID=UPI001C0697C6|nr:flavodoxin domain-containing protein [Arenibacter algicola]MBU2906405.1 hypothetical protein [Arenibacter algicola]